MISFFLASTDNDYEAAGLLFKAYAASIQISLDFQHFSDELGGLKKMYGEPYGGIILAKEQEDIIGCVAIRKISDQVGELKRMYIKPGFQNRGIGKILLEKAIELAKQCNYLVVKLDTLNYMLPAIHLYQQAGFYETPPYYNNPIPTAIYFEKLL
ncbi:MAG: GNAT family N-acetyltransferase [Ferruginibacter sp.]|nr:GNAT family N-acetyltransferase [Ferruginibacter sp.]